MKNYILNKDMGHRSSFITDVKYLEGNKIYVCCGDSQGYLNVYSKANVNNIEKTMEQQYFDIKDTFDHNYEIMSQSEAYKLIGGLLLLSVSCLAYATSDSLINKITFLCAGIVVAIQSQRLGKLVSTNRDYKKTKLYMENKELYDNYYLSILDIEKFSLSELKELKKNIEKKKKKVLCVTSYANKKKVIEYYPNKK